MFSYGINGKNIYISNGTFRGTSLLIVNHLSFISQVNHLWLTDKKTGGRAEAEDIVFIGSDRDGKD